MTRSREIRSFICRAAIACALLISSFLVTACSGSDGQTTPSAERPPVAVETSRVAPGDVKESIAVVGTLAPKFEGEVKAEYSGVITDVYVTEWVRVSRGTLLARFDTREPQAYVKSATAARLQAEVAANRARRELERTEKLKAAGLGTQQNLDDARTALEAADAQLAAAKAQEDMARTRLAKSDVRAPMDGVVAARSVNPGDFIENMGSPKPMFRIVDNRTLELTVSVPSSRISKVKLGDPLTFTTDAVPGRTFEGKVTYINPAVDEASRTVNVNVAVDNPDNALKVGLFVKGEIVTGDRKGILSVPRAAMLTYDAATRSGVVFVINGGRAQQKTVTTGVASGDRVEIVSGISPGDSVVTRGAFNLRDGDRVTAQPGA